jgi:hypothetical protein
MLPMASLQPIHETKQKTSEPKKKLTQKLKTFLATTIATTDEHATFLASFQEKFNTHHKQTRQIWQSVDKQMRRIFAGGTEYSPEFQVLRDTIEF